MSVWIKLHVEIRSNPKLLSVDAESRWLWVCGLVYAKEYQTDGDLPTVALPNIGGGLSDIHAAAERLVAAGLWERTSNGYTVGREKWARYQLTKEAVAAARQAKKEAQAKWLAEKKAAGNAAKESLEMISRSSQESAGTPSDTRQHRPDTRPSDVQTSEHMDALDNRPAETAGQRAPRPTQPPASPEATALAAQYLNARARNDGPKPTAASAATFAIKVFTPLLSEYDSAEIAEVMRYLDKPGCRWWQFVSGNPKGYEHALLRNFPAILAEARNGGPRNANASQPRVDMALVAWQDDPPEGPASDRPTSLEKSREDSLFDGLKDDAGVQS